MSVARRRFRIIKEIAEGGFGKVYLAEQISSDGFSRIVAVKLLHAKWSSHDEVVMRTRDEARLLGLIRHQHIVKVEDLTAIDGKCAIVMEYLEGCDLKWMISFLKERNEPFPRAALFEILLACASALDAAYNGTPLQGGDPLRVIHRDIKPSNIFVTTTGAVKVLDFGTARANFAEREAKTQALAFGSQGYMAPERMLGEEDTPAADVFSLGITLYELLTLESFGRIPPRPNKFAAKVQERVASVPLEGPEDWQDQVRETLRLMLSYEPSDRPSAAQLVEIMELLAQDAGDMQLRRFGRVMVGVAKESLPELDTGDPLAGTIVDEDMSGTFPLGGPNSGPQSMPAPSGHSAPQPMGFPQTSQPMGAPQQQQLGAPPMRSPQAPAAYTPGQSAPQQIQQGYQQPVSGPISQPMQTPVSMDTSAPVQTGGGGGGMGIGLVVAALAVIAIIVLIVLLVTGGAAAFFITTPTTTPEPAPTEAPAPPPAPEPVAGSRVTSPDTRADVAKIPSTLTYSDSAGGSITIKGPSGFAAEWDGKAPFELELGDGRYATVIETAGGKKVRGKRFTVEPKKKSCSFTFDVGKEDWTGSCK